MMGSEEGSTHWIVFEGVRIVASSNPETLIEIDTAITKLEFGRATALLDSPSPTSTHIVKISMSSASRAGCAALAAGKLDEALQYLNVSLSKCLPDKTSAAEREKVKEPVLLELSDVTSVGFSVSEQSLIFGYTKKKIISDVGVATSDRFSIRSLLKVGKLCVWGVCVEVERARLSESFGCKPRRFFSPSKQSIIFDNTKRKFVSDVRCSSMGQFSNLSC